MKASDVFTPSVPASQGFVGRETEIRDLEKQGLNVPGTQIVVWGESGAGKSSLVNKVLTDQGKTAVKTACTPESTYEQILAAAFSGTGAFVVTESAEHTDITLSAGTVLGSELIGAKITADGTLDTGTNLTRQPIARPQLSPQRLVAELGARGYSWVIEDFHKVEEAERLKIAHGIKVFSDDGLKYPNTRVIVLGVSESIDDLLVKPANVGSRLIDISVPPLKNDELGKILDVGERLLNIDFSLIRARLLNTAVGTASITHALALACCSERDVDESVDTRVAFTDEDFDGAVQVYARTRSGALRSRFLSALKVHRKRTYDNTKIILRALTELPESGGTVGEILGIVRRDHPSYPSGNAAKYLGELQTDERGSLVRLTSAGVFRFDEPIQHAYAKSYFGMTSAPAADTLTVTPTIDTDAAYRTEWSTLLVSVGLKSQLYKLRTEIEADSISMIEEPDEKWQEDESS